MQTELLPIDGGRTGKWKTQKYTTVYKTGSKDFRCWKAVFRTGTVRSDFSHWGISHTYSTHHTTDHGIDLMEFGKLIYTA